MKNILLSGLCLLSMISFNSCQKNAADVQAQQEDRPTMQSTVNIPTGYPLPECVIPVQTNLIAGQSINVGSVTVWNDETNIYVYYNTTDAYRLKKTHLYVGACNAIPTNGAGNPRIGHYPYQTNHGTAGVQHFTYTIPRSSVVGGCMCVSAHAEVIGAPGAPSFSETAWGQGTQINDGGSWAMKFDYCEQDCEGSDR